MENLVALGPIPNGSEKLLLQLFLLLLLLLLLLWLTFTALFDVAVSSVLNPWLDGPRALSKYFISFHFVLVSIPSSFVCPGAVTYDDEC